LKRAKPPPGSHRTITLSAYAGTASNGSRAAAWTCPRSRVGDRVPVMIATALPVERSGRACRGSGSPGSLRRDRRRLRGRRRSPERRLGPARSPRTLRSPPQTRSVRRPTAGHSSQRSVAHASFLTWSRRQGTGTRTRGAAPRTTST